MNNERSTTHVFLDTEVYKAVGFNCEARDLRLLRRLVREGSVSLVSTVVTEAEIQAHLEIQATQVAKTLSKLKQSAAAILAVTGSLAVEIRALDPARLSSDFVRAYEYYRSAVRPEVVGISDVSIQEIVSSYFARRPPFGNGKKKSEFPDAIAAAALDIWCKLHDAVLHVVSTDDDWRRVCEATEYFRYHEGLSELFEILLPNPERSEWIRAGLAKKSEELEQHLKDIFPNRRFYIDEIDGEVSGVEVIAAEFLDFHVVEATETEATVKVECSITFTAEVSYKDPNSLIWDSEDRVAHYLESVDDAPEFQYEMSAEVKVCYPQTGDQPPCIVDVRLSEDDIWLSVRDDEY